MRAARPRPTRYAGDFAFNVVLSLDTLTIHDIDGDPHHMLNIVCEGTCFQVVAYLFTGQGIPSARLVMRTFLSCWSSWAGMPQRIWCDRGKEFMGNFATSLSEHGVETTTAALESPWQNGRCERHGCIWKEMFVKVCMYTQVRGGQTISQTA